MRPLHAGQPPAAWAADFSFAYYRRLLEVARTRFALHVVGDAPRLEPTPARPALLLRHDVDVALGPARRLASLEYALGVRATYMVMLDAPLYRLDDAASRAVLADLCAMGHEIGLHFDFRAAERDAAESLAAVEPAIAAACAALEALVGRPVRAVSFHRPHPQLLRGPRWVAGRVNAYAAELMDWYLSDSAGRWRAGEPLPQLTCPRRPLLQLLTHPIWWGPRHQPPADRLAAFVARQTRGWPPPARAAYCAVLAAHIRVGPSDSAWQAPAASREGMHRERWAPARVPTADRRLARGRRWHGLLVRMDERDHPI
jgi:hypothetical protein